MNVVLGTLGAFPALLVLYYAAVVIRPLVGLAPPTGEDEGARFYIVVASFVALVLGTAFVGVNALLARWTRPRSPRWHWTAAGISYLVPVALWRLIA